MKKYTFALFLAVCVTTSVFSQAPSTVAIAESVEGLVTVSQRNTLGNLVRDLTLVNGARIAATSTGAAVIRLDNGCRIELTANQAVTIDSRLDCKALIASVQSAGPGVGAVGAGTGPFVPGIVAGALAIGLIASQNSSGS